MRQSTILMIMRWPRAAAPDRLSEQGWRLVTAAHIPHYTRGDAITGTVIFAVIFAAMLVIVAVSLFRRR